MQNLVSADFSVVPTITFRRPFVFVILSHERRRPVHFAVTERPTAEWTACQLLEAFPRDSAPRYLLRGRDKSYGEKFHGVGSFAPLNTAAKPACANQNETPRSRGTFLVSETSANGVFSRDNNQSHSCFEFRRDASVAHSCLCIVATSRGSDGIIGRDNRRDNSGERASDYGRFH